MLSKDEKGQIKNWLSDSFQAAQDFDGSEASEERLFYPLSLFDDFVRAHADDEIEPSELERKVSETAFPDHPVDMPLTVDGFLDTASEFYDRLTDTEANTDVYALIENAGGIVRQSEQVFVKTDEGQLNAATSDASQSYEVKTEPRLAMLIAHLRNDGVNGQSVYMDDLVITQGQVNDTMVREHPYNIVQIPRLDMEIAVCDQIGETTFVKKGTVGSEFWDHMSKEQLKDRDDIIAVNRHNDKQWWNDISEFLAGHSALSESKVKLESWLKKGSNLDLDLVDASLLAHRLETGEWLATGKKDQNGKGGGYVLEHGPYAGQIKVGTLEAALKADGRRGLEGSSSITQRHAIISKKHGLDYKNIFNQKDLDMDLIDKSLLAHRLATDEWLTAGKKGSDGKKGSYVLEHGPYAEEITVGSLETALSVDGSRGLEGSSSIAQRHAIIAKKHELDYHNKHDQEDLDMDLVDASLLAHRLETGEWLTAGKKANGGKKGSYVIEHGPYAGKITVSNLDAALRLDGGRGLEGTSSIPARNAVVSEQHDLDYQNRLENEDLDMDLIDESLLAHRLATGKWLSATTSADDGKKGSYVLEHGPYAGKITVNTLAGALKNDGARGLAGKSSIAQRNEVISEQNDLDYVHRLKPKTSVDEEQHNSSDYDDAPAIG